MDVSYATMEAMGMLVKRLGQDARRLENALAETMNASAEWKRIADKLIEERDAERKAHGEYKERQREIFNGNQRLTAELAVIKDERNALRAECDDLRRVFSLVHGSLGINQGEHIGNAIEALKKERDCANAERARHEAQSRSLVADVLRLTAEIERLKKPARQHPVKVGEWLKRIAGDSAGQIAQVLVVQSGQYEVQYDQYKVCWSFENCIPCDPPEATHDTPAGKETAQAAVTPHPGDVVRLINTPPEWEAEWGQIGDTGTVKSVSECDTGVRIRETGMQWPGDCIEIVQSKRTLSVPVTAVKTEPKPGDTVRLVREPSHTDIPAMLPWSKAFGMPGDTAIVVIMAVPDKVPSGTIPVRTGMGRCFFWPISCIEIVEDAK